MPQKGPRRLEADKLFDYALRALAGRAHAVAELRQKLRDRAQRLEDVPEVLARLRQYGYLDDRRFAESFSTARLESQGLGKIRVLSDLRRRQVAPAVAEKAVEAAYRGADEVALIEAWLRRKYRHTPLEPFLADKKNLASAYRRLRGAGFTSANVLRVLKRYALQPELLETLEEPEEQDRGS